jgi:hypothetical protein
MHWRRFNSPYSRARGMWRDIARVSSLDPTVFRKEFNRVYTATESLKALWQLGGALNDYLRAHPNAVAVPITLPRRLLSSHHRDARVIGLKLLVRSTAPLDEIASEISRALCRRDGYESCGGIRELGNLLDRVESECVPLADSLIERLKREVEPLIHDGVITHSEAGPLMKRLNE